MLLINQEHQLPIFWQEGDAYSLFYAPGYLVVAARLLAADLWQDLQRPESQTPAARRLRQWAETAVHTRQSALTAPFAPVCLTLYLHNQCNLRCPYCYADPSPRSTPRLDVDTVHAAARLVAENCQQQQRPFTLVCHGGGEPTLNQPHLAQVLAGVQAIAAAAALSLFRYIATNGVMPTAKAHWLAQQFDLVGLSCDGPAAIQSRQRPLANGQNSTPYVERTARILHEHQTPLHVRVTITPFSVMQQVEIAEYICRRLQPEEIHVEPVYRAGRARTAVLPDADQFVDHFLQAQQVAAAYGARWLTSGSRLQEIHGPYCHLFRDVLHLVPGDVASACFKTSTSPQAGQQGLQIGQMGDGRFTLNQPHITALRQQLHPLPPPCQDCFNQYHCARDCPDNCPLEDGETAVPSFRCRVQKKLAQVQLTQMGAGLWAKARSQDGIAEGRVMTEIKRLGD
ncbi:MAG: hypothetical protein HND44_13650 [Chloroflexi bacterium]|nr:hypothetical protein [Ardenticatenaceae bacterium]MBL1129519.1 hypothetical protein [Chloroflexota bacterium]NOG35601.1 hypothetical protein [Chloroflexota bacterium]GIK58517.1 MAG: nif11-like peptide radical SAM maturase [Chloroflexota bacterium]